MDTKREDTAVKEPHLEYLFTEMKAAESLGIYKPHPNSPAITQDEDQSDLYQNNEIDFAQALGNLGAIIGIGPFLVTLGVIITELASVGNTSNGDIGAWIGLSIISSLFGSPIGYALGKSVGKALSDIRNRRHPLLYVLAVPFFGSFWGAISGAAAGLPIFVIGAFFGAFVGAAVGIVAAIYMALVFEGLAERGKIGVGLSLPISFGFVAVVLAFFFGSI